MSTQKEESAKVEEPVVNQSANNAATTATKKRRRGISNETRTTARKKFSHKDAINNLWLFVGHLHARVAWVTIKLFHSLLLKLLLFILILLMFVLLVRHFGPMKVMLTIFLAVLKRSLLIWTLLG